MSRPAPKCSASRATTCCGSSPPARAASSTLVDTRTVASVAGGYGGYAIGALLFDAVGQPILDFYDAGAAFAEFTERYNAWGAWTVAFFGVTPFPYKVITIASGVTALDLGIFIIASLLSRGLRFYGLCGLLYWFGAPIREFIERYLGLVFTAFVILLIGGFAVAKYVL